MPSHNPDLLQTLSPSRVQTAKGVSVLRVFTRVNQENLRILHNICWPQNEQHFLFRCDNDTMESILSVLEEIHRYESGLHPATLNFSVRICCFWPSHS